MSDVRITEAQRRLAEWTASPEKTDASHYRIVVDGAARSWVEYDEDEDEYHDAYLYRDGSVIADDRAYGNVDEVHERTDLLLVFTGSS